MKNHQQVIGIRCHYFGEQEQFLYENLLKYFQEDTIFFIVDELKEVKEFPKGLKKIALSDQFLQENGLYSKGRVAWACGDYFYYVFRQRVDADYYWLIEPDVLLNLDSIEDFFGFFANKQDDALVMDFTKATEEWVWYETAKTLLDPPYKCFFPLTRLSKKSIEVMYKKRQVVSFVYLTEKQTEQFPNDESLLANALMEVGIEPVNLSSYFPDYFDYFSIAPARNLKLSMGLCHNQIIHPVKSLMFYKHAIEAMVNDFFNNGLIHRLSNSILDDDEYKELIEYSKILFEENLLRSFGAKNRVNFTLYKLLLIFKEQPKINLKKVVRVKNELVFFMGQGNLIAFVFEDKFITVYKRVYLDQNPEPIETQLQQLPIELINSFEALETEMIHILQKYEIKKGALKQKISQA